MNKYLMICALATAGVLSACGGSDDEPVATAPGEVPTSVSASSSSLVAYLTQWSLGVADEQTLVSVASFAPPLPDDTLPDLLK